MKALRDTRLAAVLALAGCLGLLWLEGFARHTDDGCQVETHCLVCRTAVVRASSAHVAVDVTPVLAAVAFMPVPMVRRATVRPLVVHLSRGPPLST